MKKSTLLFLVILGVMSVLIVSNSAYASGSALSFNGQSNYVHLNNRALNGLNDCTVEYWVQIIPDDDAASVISAALSNRDSDEYLHIFLFNGGFRPYIHEETPDDGRGFSRRQWFHFAMTREGGSGDWITYINGEEIDSGRLPSGPLEIDENGLVLGQHQGEVEGGFSRNEALRGSLDELRIWNVVRTPQQIRDNVHSQVPANSFGLNAYYRFDEGEGQVLNDLTNNNYHGRLGETDGEDDDSDPRWINSNAIIYGGVADISAEAIVFGPIVQDRPTEFVIRIENISDVDDEFHTLVYSFEDEELDPDWLEIENASGEIAAGEAAEITFTADPEGLDLGEYAREVEFDITASNVQSITMPASMIIVEGAGSLSGTITREANDAPIAGAIIQAAGNFPYRRVTDEDGNYQFDILPTYNYTFEIAAADYMPATVEDVEIGDGEDVELNVSLLHAEFVATPDFVEEMMDPDQILDIDVDIANEGNTELIWSMEITFPDVAESDPWELLHTIEAEEILEDSRLYSAIFIDDHYYIGKGVRNGDNLIYVLNLDGEVVRQFTQEGESSFGYRDMAWDGELIWAYVDEIIYGFHTDGELERSFESPLSPMRGITWDQDNQHLWICSTHSDLYAVDLDGDILRQIDDPDMNLTITGLSWFGDDPDDYSLYAFCQDGNSDRQIYKINTENSDAILMHEPFGADGRAGSSFISGLWDPNKFVFIGMTDRPDNIYVWNIQQRSEWLAAEPNEGVVPPGENGELTITLDTEALPAEIQYNGNLHFTHNAADGETNILVTVFILGEGGEAERTIPLSIGWNLISTNVDPPEDLADFSDIVAPLVDEGLLIMAKDGEGNFYVPGEDFDQIGDWQWMSGYWLRLNGSAMLSITGEMIQWNTAMDLTEGWNLISYLPLDDIDPAGGFRNLGDALIIVKDGSGSFYIPEWDFSSISILQAGRGYQVKVNADIELIYSLQGNEGDAVPPTYSYKDRNWINSLTNTGISHSLLLISDNLLTAGSRVEAFTPAGILAGRGVADGSGRLGIALWGDDPQTMENDGFRVGDNISLTLLNNNTAINIARLDGKVVGWEADSWGVASIKSAIAPFEFGLGKAYPNPFNSRTIISFSLEVAESVSLRVFDIAGREVAILVAGNYSAGQHQILWDASNVPSGIYSLQLKSPSSVQFQKVVLLK